MIRPLLAVVGLLLFQGSVGPSAVAQKVLDGIFNRWRWMHYWEDATDLGANYIEGKNASLLLFWPADNTQACGFCSTTLGVCQFYPSVSAIYNHDEMQISSNEDNNSAFRKFKEEDFKQQSNLATQKPPLVSRPEASEYRVEALTIALPKLDPPKAIVTRTARTNVELEALARQVGCPSLDTQCKSHLLVPYYGDNDLWTPVYRECSSECDRESRPAILFPKLVEGRWWLGATNIDTNKEHVLRTKEKILKALMTDMVQ